MESRGTGGCVYWRYRDVEREVRKVRETGGGGLDGAQLSMCKCEGGGRRECMREE